MRTCRREVGVCVSATRSLLSATGFLSGLRIQQSEGVLAAVGLLSQTLPEGLKLPLTGGKRRQ